MSRRDNIPRCIRRLVPAIFSARDDDDWLPDSDTNPEVESDADEYGDFHDWPPDELDLEIDDEPEPEPGDFWMDADDEED